MAKLIVLAVVAATAIAFTGTAQAQQFTATSDIVGGGTSYTGPGTEGINANGTVFDGGGDAFDGFGGYVNTGGLGFTRQTEQFGNTYRFFDTFTNTTGGTITQTVRFTGDLGSDAATNFLTNMPGISVTCQNNPCSGDPVVAVVYSNNGSGVLSFGPGIQGPLDRLSVDFALTLAAGQSASLLNFAFLASDINGTNANDVTLANTTAQSLRSNPNFAGLTAAQIARTVNFSQGQPGAVPEPATWAIMVMGFGLVGGALRRRARPAAALA